MMTDEEVHEIIQSLLRASSNIWVALASLALMPEYRALLANYRATIELQRDAQIKFCEAVAADDTKPHLRIVK